MLGDEELLARSNLGDVYAIDLRGHGRSRFAEQGCKVKDLAEDLREFIAKEAPPRLTVCGSSMGVAIICAHCEHHGLEGISNAVFVDQAPLQYEAEGWILGSKGLRTPADLAGLQKALAADMVAFAAGNAECCLVSPASLDPNCMEELTAETLRCDPAFLGSLMADHTERDWRETLRNKWPASVGVLNLAGRHSGVFPPEGVKHINELLGDKVRHAFEVYEDCSHWLYLEQPKKFVESVVAFIAGSPQQ